MQTININALAATRIILGKQGENQATKIAFRVAPFLEMWPNATISLAVQPPKGNAYPATVTVENGVASWVVSSSDTAYAGDGKCELRVIEGEVIKKSVTFPTRIIESFTATGEAPDPLQDWIEEAEEKLEEVEASTQAANEAAQAASEAAQEATAAAQIASTKVNKPTSGDGTSGQVLQTNGDGTTSWVDQTGGGGSVVIDDTLTQQGEAADAKAAGDRIGTLETGLTGKVNKPSGNGTSGQVLQTNGDGTTSWVDQTSGVTIDDTLTQEGEAADAKAAGDRIIALENGITGKVNKPSGNGTNGQVLKTNGDGSTDWVTVQGSGTVVIDDTVLKIQPTTAYTGK